MTAAEQFTALGDYKDSAAKVAEAYTSYGQTQLDAQNYDDAKKAFEKAGDVEKSKETDYLHAKNLMNSGDYSAAKELLYDLAYEDAGDLEKECTYNLAVKAYEEGKLEDAITMLEEISEYGESTDRLHEYKYELAGNHFAAEEYDKAESLYRELGEYEDAPILAEKASFFQTTDGQFILAVVRGLEARWDATETQTVADSELDTIIDLELAEVESFYDAEFSDVRLGEIAREYVDKLNEGKEAVRYVTNNYMVFQDKWNAARAGRLHLIEEMVNSYGLTVDEKYQRTLDQLVGDSQVYAEQEAFEASLQEVVDNLVLYVSPYKDDYTGSVLWYDYYMTITNTTDQDLKQFWIEAQVMDSSGHVWSDGTAMFENVAVGQTVTVQMFFSSTDYDVTQYNIEYTISSYITDLYTKY